MMKIRQIVLPLIACTAVGPYLRAQIPSQHGRIPPVPRDPEYPGTTRVPQERKDAIVLPTEPPDYGQDPGLRSAGVIARVQPETPPLPDGYVVADRGGRVERRGDWHVVELQDVAGLPPAPPLRVLPNRQLGLLETVLTAQREPPPLIFSGRVTTFNGANYLLIERVLTGSAPPPPPDVTPDRSPTPTQPALPDTQPMREPTTEELVQRLMQGQPRRALVVPPPQTSPATRPADIAGDSSRQREETILVDRPGRLIPGEAWWTFAFDDLGQSPAQKPIRLLPSQLLEVAINLTNGGAGGVVLIVSGEVTAHRGMDYLLLRKVLVRRNLGNFR